jgi:hypothetical protein
VKTNDKKMMKNLFDAGGSHDSLTMVTNKWFHKRKLAARIPRITVILEAL